MLESIQLSNALEAYMKNFNNHAYQAKKMHSYLGFNIPLSFLFLPIQTLPISFPQENLHEASMDKSSSGGALQIKKAVTACPKLGLFLVFF